MTYVIIIENSKTADEVKVNITNFESTIMKETTVYAKPKIIGDIKHLTMRKLNEYERLKLKNLRHRNKLSNLVQKVS